IRDKLASDRLPLPGQRWAAARHGEDSGQQLPVVKLASNVCIVFILLGRAAASGSEQRLRQRATADGGGDSAAAAARGVSRRRWDSPPRARRSHCMTGSWHRHPLRRASSSVKLASNEHGISLHCGRAAEP
ncbi:hypothetical protein Dimus_029654, partial [Dionaea muscipula]